MKVLGLARIMVTCFVLGARKKADSGLKSFHLQNRVCVQQLVANCMGKFYWEICKDVRGRAPRPLKSKDLGHELARQPTHWAEFLTVNFKLKLKQNLTPLAGSVCGNFQ